MKWFVGLALIAGLFYVLSCPRYEIVHPEKPADFRRISAMILTGTSSGSGIVLHSDPLGSDILTAQHVCIGAAKEGAYIWVERKKHVVVAIKPSANEDLCLMHTKDNLMVGTEVAELEPKFGDELRTAGHPLHMPLMYQQGWASESFNVLAGSPFKSYLMLTSVLVQPGQSGSGVFDASGRIVGILVSFKTAYPKMEGSKETMGFGLSVLHSYIKLFVESEATNTQWTHIPDASRAK